MGRWIKKLWKPKTKKRPQKGKKAKKKPKKPIEGSHRLCLDCDPMALDVFFLVPVLLRHHLLDVKVKELWSSLSNDAT